MPKDMPANLTALKNQLSQPGAWVWLMTFALPDDGGTLRFVANTEDVVYGGETYTAFSFSVGSFQFNLDGEIPEVTMTVTNVGYVLQQYVRDYEGLIDGTVSFVTVNTDYLAEDYSDDVVTLTITGCENAYPDVTLTLSVPAELRQRVPEDRFNPHSCRHAFRLPNGEYSSRCGYTGQSIASVTLAAGSPVAIEVTGHGFTADDEVRIFDVVGISDLHGDYAVTVVDANNFTLNGTDSSDYSGTFASGSAGYAHCDRIPEDCALRGRFPGDYGGPLSLRREAVRYA